MDEQTSPRELSVRQSVFAKIFPVAWCALWGIGVLALWMDWLPGEAPLSLKWFFLAGWIAGSGLMFLFLMPLKNVRLDRQYLYVSSASREVRVPLAEIARVTENRWMRHHPVTIYFRSPTEFGERVTFMPKNLPFPLWRSHPVVAELRQAGESASRPEPK